MRGTALRIVTATLVLGSGLCAIGTPAGSAVTTADGAAVTMTNRTVAAGHWNNDLIWSLGRAPRAGDHVVVGHAVVLRGSSPMLT